MHMRLLSIVGVAVVTLVLGSCAPSTVTPQASEATSAPQRASEVLLVHLLPGSGGALWLLDGEPIGTTSADETSGYLEIPVMEGTLTARIAGVEALGASIESQDGWRYVAYLHEGPDGTPAVVWTPGHRGQSFAASGAQYFRVVNLVPTLSNVKIYPVESCGHPYEIVARPYGTAQSPIRVTYPNKGPTTICDGEQKLLTLPAAEEDEPDQWHAAPNRVKSVVLFQHGGELRATLVDETP